jgi:hypothetical protein
MPLMCFLHDKLEACLRLFLFSMILIHTREIHDMENNLIINIKHVMRTFETSVAWKFSPCQVVLEMEVIVDLLKLLRMIMMINLH